MAEQAVPTVPHKGIAEGVATVERDIPIHKLSPDEEMHAKVCLYGISGVGKTKFLTTMPGPRFMLNFEKENILVLKMARAEVEIADISSKPHPSGYEQILGVLLMLQDRAKKGILPKTVCIDTGGGMYGVVMRYLLKVQGKEAPTQPDWGLAHERMKDRINDFIDLPCNLLVIFHESMDKDQVTGRFVGNINVPGKDLPTDLMKKFNLSLHYTMETGATLTKDTVPKRLIHTVPTSTFPACDKTGALDPIEEPDFAKMWAKVEAKRKAVKP